MKDMTKALIDAVPPEGFQAFLVGYLKGALVNMAKCPACCNKDYAQAMLTNVEEFEAYHKQLQEKK